MNLTKIKKYYNSTNSSKLAFLWGAGLIANSSGWVFTLLANRVLSLADMGTLGFYVSLLTLVSIFSVSLGITVNRFQASNSLSSINKLEQMQNLGIIGTIIGLFSSLAFLVFVVFYPESISGITQPHLVLSLSTLFTLMFPLAWYRSMMQAEKQFVSVGIILLSEAVLKLSLGFTAFLNRSSVAFFMLTLPISTAFALITSHLSHHQKLNLKTTVKLQDQVKMFITKTLVMRFGLIALMSIDMVMAKWFLSPQDAGIYALLSLVGKMIYFANQSFYTLLAPAVSPYLERKGLRRLILGSLVVPMLVLSVFLIILFTRFPALSLGMLLGERYLLIQPYITQYALASTFVSLLLLFSLYDLLRDRYWLSFSLLGVLGIEIILFILRHESITHLVQNVFFASGLACLWVIGVYARIVYKESVAQN